MALKINVPEPDLLKPRISIFGVGGAGGNALNNMIRSNLEGVEFIAANTDAQSLANSLAANRIQLGVNLTKGLGAGSFPDRGRAAAEENIDEIVRYLEGNNMIFITAGMGGGTGTGAAPVIAKLARERDILTVGVVTKPFQFEGKYRMESAEVGIEELKKHVDTLIVIPNQNLFRIANEQTTFESAFKMADNVLHAGVRGVTDLITMPGLVNLDFADIRTIMTKMGKALMGTGEAEGENRAVRACEEAISNPLLDDVSIKGAKGVLVNMTGGPDMTLFEADLAVNTIKREVDPSANIIFGSAFNEDMKGKIRISVVATGIDENDNYIPRSDETLKAKSQMVHEIDNNPDAEQEEDIVNSAMQGKKTFFDPGIAKEIDEVINEVTKDDFSNQNISKQDWQSLEKVAHVIEEAIEEKISQMEEESSTSIAFEEKDIFDKVSETIEKLEEKAEKKVKESSKSKKEGGFSLFGFMSSSKTSNVDEERPKEKLKIKLPPKEKLQDRFHEKPKLTRQTVTIEDIEGEEEISRLTKKSSHSKIAEEKSEQDLWQEEKSKKVDRTPDKGDFSVEDNDDILNVPAFFRRKK